MSPPAGDSLDHQTTSPAVLTLGGFFLWVIQLHKRVIPEWAKRLARKGFKTKYTHPEEYSSYLDENLSEIEKYQAQIKGQDLSPYDAKAVGYVRGRDLVTIFKIGED